MSLKLRTRLLIARDTLGLKQFSVPIAWNASRNLVAILGVIYLFCFVGTMPWYVQIFAWPTVIGIWFCAYQFERNWRKRRLERFNYE